MLADTGLQKESRQAVGYLTCHAHLAVKKAWHIGTWHGIHMAAAHVVLGSYMKAFIDGPHQMVLQ